MKRKKRMTQRIIFLMLITICSALLFGSNSSSGAEKINSYFKTEGKTASLSSSSKTTVDQDKIEKLANRSFPEKYNTANLSNAEIKQLGLRLFGSTQLSGTHVCMKNDKGEEVDIPFKRSSSSVFAVSSSSRFNMGYTMTGFGVTTTFPYMAHHYMDSKYAYCMDPQSIFYDAHTYNSQTLDISNHTYKNLNDILNFGAHDGSDETAAGYTQLLVWARIGWTVKKVNGIGTLVGFQNYQKNVESKIQKWYAKPSFDNQTVNVKLGETKKLIDSNHSIDDMMLESNTTGTQVTKINNELSIRATSVSNTNGLIIFRKKTPLSDTPLIWTSPGSQSNVTGGRLDPSSIVGSVKINVLKNGNIRIKKVDANTGVTLANAKFKLSYNGRMTELTTNASGEAELKDILDGTQVTIQEITAPNGYVITKTPQTVTVAADQTKTVTFKDKKQVGQVTLTKQDKETGNTPQGDATLNGAVYGLFTSAGKKVQDLTIKKTGTVYQAVAKNLSLGKYYLQELKAPAGYLLDDSKLSFSIDYAGQDKDVSVKAETEKDQVIKGAIEGYKFADRPLIDKMTSSIKRFFTGKNTTMKPPLKGVEITATAKTTGKKYTGVTDENGHFKIEKLPFDTYHVEETKGLEGYLLFDPFDVTVKEDGYVFHYLLEDRVIQATLKVVKKDKSSGKVISRAGATFKIWDRWAKGGAGDWVWMRKPNDTEKTDEFVTNEKGYLVTSDMLRYGQDRYELHEIQAPEGYQLAKDFAVFSIKKGDADTVVTLPFDDEVQMGQVKVHKSVQTGTAIEAKKSPYGDYHEITYSQQAGEGFSFKVRAAEDILTPDGVVHQKKGEVIKNTDGSDLVLTTDKDGNVTSPPTLYLGKYELLETHAPLGVVPHKEPLPFELTYAGQTVDVTSTTVTLDNQLQKIHVHGHKNQERITQWNKNHPKIKDEPANGQVFGLFSGQELKVGTETLEKDSCLGYATVKDGQFTYDGYLLAGDYYFKEVDAGKEYVLDPQHYPFTYTPTDNDEDVTIHVWGNKQDKPDRPVDPTKPVTIVTAPGPKAEKGEPILNKLYHIDIPFKKLDESPLPDPKQPNGVLFKYGKDVGAGAVFELKDAKKHVIQTVTMNKQGVGTWKDLPVGTFYEQETKAPDGRYLVNKEILTFEITKTTVTVTNEKGKVVATKDTSDGKPLAPVIAVRDPIKKGTVRVKKVDSRTLLPLANATIQVKDKKGHVLVTKKTNKKGTFEVKNLPVGTYTLKEIQAPMNYERQDKETTVILTEDQETVTGLIADTHVPILQSGIQQPTSGQLLLCGGVALFLTFASEGKNWWKKAAKK